MWQGRGVPKRADLDKQPGDVADMFDDVARRHDLMNDLMTFGQVRSWRKAVVAAIAPEPGERPRENLGGMRALEPFGRRHQLRAKHPPGARHFIRSRFT